MLIKHFKIWDYKPFVHCGTKSVELDFVSKTLVCIGTNGCGKSSLLRELTPLPSVKTDYLSDGGKELVIMHDNEEYLVKSIFSGSRGFHSFSREGEELNESGTSGTQTELCETLFGLTNEVAGVINFSYEMCTMARNERKTLLLSTYPSDLSFILQMHKKVLSNLRSFKSNINMLKERELALKDKVMDPKELVSLKSTKKELEEITLTLDKYLFLLNNELSSLKSRGEYLDWEENEWTVERIKERCSEIKDRAMGLRRKKPKLFEYEDPSVQKNVLHEEKEAKEKLLVDLQNESKAIKEEIDLFQSYSGRDLQTEVQRMQNDITRLSKKKETIVVDKNIPLIHPSELERVETSTYPDLKALITHIASCGELWPSQAIDNSWRLLAEWEDEIGYLNKQIDDKIRILKDVDRREVKNKELVYPLNCSLKCNLKDYVDFMRKQANYERKQVQDEINSLTKKRDSRVKPLQKLKERIQGPNDARDTVVKLLNILQFERWSDFVFNGKRPFSVLKHSPTSILTQVGKIVQNSKNQKELREIDSRLDKLRMEHDALTKANLPAKEFIEQAMKTKTAKLEEMSERFKTIVKEIDSLKEDVKLVDRKREFLDELSEIANQHQANANYEIIYAHIAFYEKLKRAFESKKLEIGKSLVNIDDTINEQTGLMTRLDEEIKPNLKTIGEKVELWSKIEMGLSPSSGLPHVYMVRYLNSLILNVNKIIASVWGYDMEVEPLSEDGSLDFTFKVIMNKNTTVRDISVCSKSQKKILDLAWILALFSQLKLGDEFPLKLDEVDDGMSEGNRTRLLSLLSSLTKTRWINQMILVNHHASLFSGFDDAQTLCIKEEDILLPSEYNQHATVL